MNCVQCGTEIAEGARFCRNCGTPTPAPQAAVEPPPPSCPNCGARDELVSAFCANCGQRLRDAAQVPAPSVAPAPASAPAPPAAAPGSATPATAAQATAAAGEPYASIGDRLLGQVVDGLAGGGLFFFLGRAVGQHSGGNTSSGFEINGSPALVVFALLAITWFGYFIVAEALFGRTLGKVAAGTRVVTTEGGRITPRQAVIRNLWRFIDGIVFYLIGGIVAMMSDKKQRLGDRFAGTVVLRREPERSARLMAVGAAFAALVVGVVAGFTFFESGSDLTATLARDVTSDYKAVQPTNTFPTSARSIYVAFRLKAGKPNSELEAVWTAVNIGSGPPNTVIDSTAITAPQVPISGDFVLKSSNAFPAGQYKVEIYVNGKLTLTLPFTVTK